MTPAPDAAGEPATAGARDRAPRSEDGPGAADAWDDLLRAEFGRAAHDVTPGPAPLAAVLRAGRARRRRRTVALSVLAVLGVPAAVAAGTALVRDPHPAAGLAAPPARPAASAPPASGTPSVPSASGAPSVPPSSGAPSVPPSSGAPSVPPSSGIPSVPPASGAPSVPSVPQVPVGTSRLPGAPVRTVAAGERVAAAPGWTVWLTARGKHWEGGEDGLEQFRSVTDGNVDLSTPGLSHQGEGTFHSGLYHGTRAAGRVELADARGRVVEAALLELPGSPGWGVWYAVTPDEAPVALRLYDRAGRLLSELPAV
ncbi:hypothetical protein AB0E83_21050 [Streptomyces sp. NPDC035033]|uniref:hypothetical protein n=1 Tax=Streptomyces sp. NPDC035033 TaxID=3155368 RepID=UPI003404FB43